MSNLLKRLRGPVGAGMTGESALAMAEAADEIERLHGVLAEIEKRPDADGSACLPGGHSRQVIPAEGREAAHDPAGNAVDRASR